MQIRGWAKAWGCPQPRLSCPWLACALQLGGTSPQPPAWCSLPPALPPPLPLAPLKWHQAAPACQMRGAGQLPGHHSHRVRMRGSSRSSRSVTLAGRWSHLGLEARSTRTEATDSRQRYCCRRNDSVKDGPGSRRERRATIPRSCRRRLQRQPPQMPICLVHNALSPLLDGRQQ